MRRTHVFKISFNFERIIETNFLKMKAIMLNYKFIDEKINRYRAKKLKLLDKMISNNKFEFHKKWWNFKTQRKLNLTTIWLDAFETKKKKNFFLSNEMRKTFVDDKHLDRWFEKLCFNQTMTSFARFYRLYRDDLKLRDLFQNFKSQINSISQNCLLKSFFKYSWNIFNNFNHIFHVLILCRKFFTNHWR